LSIRPEEIRAIRRRMGLSQKQLAARLGVARATIWRWETGVNAIEPLSAKLLEILARGGAPDKVER
jgi:DNA-binding transcriptional regulator YiaG